MQFGLIGLGEDIVRFEGGRVRLKNMVETIMEVLLFYI